MQCFHTQRVNRAEIPPVVAQHLIASYRDANYRINASPESFTLRIDQYSEPLARFLAASKLRCAAIVSAYNPGSRLSSEEDNSAAHAALRNLLQQHPHTVIEGLHTDPAGAWPAEKSFFIAGMDLDAAKLVGQQFNQNAVVWIDHDAIPRLILLR
ncbi:MAG: DUF3293 domain-containing protein [Proteobacteria bacterium]|nr:DUF3293 domain-containing protein [Pseudomonadota bacterium]